MSHKKPLNLWRSDKPQPSEFDKQRDPMHNMGFSDEVQNGYCTRIVVAIKAWMAKKSNDFDSAIRSIRQDWISSGGSSEVFEAIQQKAFLDSGYYQNLLKA